MSKCPVNSDVSRQLVVESVEKLEQTGLNVKVVIGDQVSNNRRDF